MDRVYTYEDRGHVTFTEDDSNLTVQVVESGDDSADITVPTWVLWEAANIIEPESHSYLRAPRRDALPFEDAQTFAHDRGLALVAYMPGRWWIAGSNDDVANFIEEWSLEIVR